MAGLFTPFVRRKPAFALYLQLLRWVGNLQEAMLSNFSLLLLCQHSSSLVARLHSCKQVLVGFEIRP